MFKLPLLLIVAFPLIAFGQSPRHTELNALADKMRQSGNANEVLLSLKPVMDDFQGIFQSVQDVGDVWMYTEDVYMDLEKNPLNIPAENSEIHLTEVMVVDLKADKDTGLPSAYTDMANRMKPTARLYAIEFRTVGAEDGLAIHVFFHVNNRWVYIPQAYKAFE